MASSRSMPPLAPSLVPASSTSAHHGRRSGLAGIRSYVDGTSSTAAGPSTSSSSSAPFGFGGAGEMSVLPRSSSVMLGASSTASPSPARPYGNSSATLVTPRPLSSAAHATFNVHPCFRKDAQWRGDVLVKVQGVQFWCHKAVLYFASPFFQAVIDGDWVESHPSLHRVPSISSVTSALSAGDGHGDEERDGSRETPKLGGSQREGVERWKQEPHGLSAGLPPRPDSAVESQEEDGQEGEDQGDEGDAAQSFFDQQRPLLKKTRQRDSFHTAIIDLEEASSIVESRLRWSQSSASTPPPVGTVNAAIDVPDSESASASPMPGTQVRRRRSASEGGSAERLYKSKAKAPLTAVDASGTTARLEPAAVTTAVSAPGTPSLVQSQHSGADLSVRLESLATPPGSPALRMASLPSSTPDSMGNVRKSAGEREQGETTSKHPSRGTKASSSSKRDRDGIVAIIELPEEEAVIFQDVLFHIYPQLDLLVNWTNIAGLLRFDEQYEIHGLRRSCATFLRAALAGRPVQAMSLAEAHARGPADLPGGSLGLEDIYKEASRHVLDMWSSLEGDELGALSSETLLKLERKRTWFLERLLKLGLANPERDYECHASCPDPPCCAKTLSDRFRSAFSACFRHGPPQPSVIWRLRELEGVPNPPCVTLSCDAAARAWTQNLFDRMFSLPLTSRAQSKFLYIKLHEANALHPYRNVTSSTQVMAGGGGGGGGAGVGMAGGGSGVGNPGGGMTGSTSSGGVTTGIGVASSLLPRLTRN